MSQPRVLVLRAPGTNCDLETAFAFERAGAAAQRLHVRRLLETPARLADYQILCLPGGFSYGDDLGAGRILGNQIRHHLADCLAGFKQSGKLILGICNGFQVLIKSGILLDTPPPGAHPHAGTAPAATLTWNASGRFEDRWVQLKTDGDRCVFFQGIDSMYLPVAHAEGRFVARDEQVLDELQSAGRLALRYAAADSQEPVEYPANPNGSDRAVAALCDPSGRVCGLMPHPERHIDPTQHPRWTRQQLAEEGDGLQVFRNAVRYFS